MLRGVLCVLLASSLASTSPAILRAQPSTTTRVSIATGGDQGDDHSKAWFILKSSSNYSKSRGIGWGAMGDHLVPGDYDGDGTTDMAVFRPSTGEWYVLPSSNGFASGLPVVKFGQAGDIPVNGDFDGDGKKDRAVYRPSSGTWFWLKSSAKNTQWEYTGWGVQAQGDVPVPGDYDGDGRADPCVFRPQHATWFILRSGTNYTKYWAFGWGLASDIPLGGQR